MNFDQFDKQVRDAALQRAFPVERETPDRLRQLLEQLASRGSDNDRRGGERAGWARPSSARRAGEISPRSG